MLSTDRLLLRAWRESDREPYAQMNMDADVMRYFEEPFTLEESNASVDRAIKHHKENGFTFFATELKETGEFIGFIGLKRVSDDVHFAPAVEIGWRLMPKTWGQGLAPEGAKACLAYAFSRPDIEEIVSFTSHNNTPSMRVMEKIGMTRDHEGDFDHPAVTKGHEIERHVLYRLHQDDFRG